MFNFDGLIEQGSRDEFLLRQLDPHRLPSHIAVIMDGNGRWANQQGKPRVMGHPAGVEAVRSTVETSARLGISTLTLYAFSMENWKRPRLEIEMLFRLLRESLRRELPVLLRHNVRIRFIGRMHELDKTIQREIQRAIHATQQNTGMVLNIALNYGARTELVDAFQKLAAECQQTGRSMNTITETDVARHLYTETDPDLLIRTSGEMRLSNFLLWQLAYTEIFVTDTYWPDFRRSHLLEAILAFQQRNRRFGGVKAADRPASALA